MAGRKSTALIREKPLLQVVSIALEPELVGWLEAQAAAAPGHTRSSAAREILWRAKRELGGDK